jgi:hypothetical protein
VKSLSVPTRENIVAKRKPTSTKALPEPGAAFAFLLEDNRRYGVCRVLRHMTASEQKVSGAPLVLVATSSWIGERIPNCSEPALREILVLTHHSWLKKAQIVWVEGSPPKGFELIGMIPPTVAEKKLPSNVHGGWEGARLQALLQWRWDHEREAVLVEDAANEKERLKQIDIHSKNRKKELRKLTLESLSKHRFLKRWKEYPSKEVIRKSRAILKLALRTLTTLGKRAPVAARKAVLQKCIESFNELDEQNDHFIDTDAREDICEEFYLMVNACGLGKYTELADEWRDW